MFIDITVVIFLFKFVDIALGICVTEFIDISSVLFASL